MLPSYFHDCDEQLIQYDGSPVSWRVSAYGIVVKDDQILVLKNSEEKMYDIPGGGVEYGETIAETVVREGLEEAGAELRISTLLHHSEDFFYHRELRQFFQTLQLFYKASLITELQKPSDPRTVSVEWIPRANCPDFPLPTAVKQAILHL